VLNAIYSVCDVCEVSDLFLVLDLEPEERRMGEDGRWGIRNEE
jgi:hypothetical protein